MDGVWIVSFEKVRAITRLLLCAPFFTKTCELVNWFFKIVSLCISGGDIHGQLYDLIKILKLQGMWFQIEYWSTILKWLWNMSIGQPSPTNLYLFNGDIVDKGQCSIECMLLLFVYKLTYPHYVFINRGNHESALVNVRHGFQKEIFR